MGLDSYVKMISKEAIASDTEFSNIEEYEPTEVHYWRKNNAMQRWMSNLYKYKGGDDPDFNCCIVVLTLTDILKLQKDILDGKLLPQEGFFYGAQVYDDYRKKEDLEFCGKALGLLLTAPDEVLYYTAWY